MTVIDAVSLEHPEEPFHERIVGTAADAAHAAGHVLAFQETLVLVARELATTIGMQYERRSVLSLLERHEHCLQNQRSIPDDAHRPANE